MTPKAFLADALAYAYFIWTSNYEPGLPQRLPIPTITKIVTIC